MPAPILRSYSTALGAVDPYWQDVMTVVPANRALVVSKLMVVARTGGNVAFGLRVLLGSGGEQLMAFQISLPTGSVYTETGIVVASAAKIQANHGTLNGIYVTIFGEEVDN